MDTAELEKSRRSTSPPRAWVPWLLRALSIGALGVAAYLSWTSLGATQVAGCGEGGTWDCHTVLQSRWSKWLGVPVSLPAAAIYVTLLTALCFVGAGASVKTRRVAWSIVALLAMMAGAAAIWFMCLQLFVLQGFCVYCVSVHATGLAILVVVLLARPLPADWLLRLSGVASLGIAALIAGQVLVEPAPKYQVETYAGGGAPESESAVQDQSDGGGSDVMELVLPEEAAPDMDDSGSAGQTAADSAGHRRLQPVSVSPAAEENHETDQPRRQPSPQPSLGPLPALDSAEAGSQAEDPAQANRSDAANQGKTDESAGAGDPDKKGAEVDRATETKDTAEADKTAEAGKGREANNAGKSESNAPKSQSHGSRVITVLDGQARLDIKGRPLIGSRDATHILIELFDYTCVHCRELHKNLHRAQALYGDQLAVLALPLPLNSQCNNAILSTAYVHRDACDLARCALAVWRRKPEAFPQYHSWLLEAANGRTVADARARAAQLIGQDVLRKELSGTVLDVYFQQHAGLYRRANKGALPQLMSSAFTLKGEVGFAELCRLLEEKLQIRRKG